MKKLLLAFILITTVSINAFSQCVVNWPTGTNVVNTATGFLWGQSFQATCSGNLNYVQLISNSTGTTNGATLKIYAGDNVSTTPIYTQAFSAIVIANVGDPIRIMVTGIVPVVNGSTYTFEFMCNNVNVLADFGGGYVSGQAYQTSAAVPTADFTFSVDIANNSGIAELSSANLSVYPNPATNVLTIETTDQIKEILISDIKGSLVKAINDDNNTIDIAELSKGMYFLTVKTNNGIARSRFIKD